MSVCDGRTPADYGFTVEGWLTGIEPATPGATVRCSNQLSYSHHGPTKLHGYSFARSWYSPVEGFTLTLSPVPMNSGTFTVTPFSSFAGFCDAVFVAVFITGEVSTTSSVSEFGSRIATGRPS